MCWWLFPRIVLVFNVYCMSAFFVQQIWILPFIAFLGVVALTPFAIRVAPALHLVDAPDGPDGRKRHEGAIPLIGGLVIFPVFIVCSLIAGFSWETHWPLYSAIALLLLTGGIDDKVHLHPWLKFFTQFCAAGLIILPGGAQIHQLGDLFGLGFVGLDFMSLPFSFAAVVLLINAVNLMDGLDGLSAGCCAVALSWIAFGFYAAGFMADFYAVLILIAAIIGFLLFNMRTPMRGKAALFLGDAGSLSLGLCLAWFALYVGKDPDNAPLPPMSVAWILAVPILDTCAQFYRRVRAGRHPFSPDRGHFHHHFVHAEVPVSYAVAVILLITFLTGAFGVLGSLWGIPPAVITMSWVAALLMHIAYSEEPDRYISLIRYFFRK